MKTPLALVALLAASSAVAQTAPSVSKKSPFQHSVELGYVTTANDLLDTDDFSGFTASARAYVWQNVFLTLQYVDVSADTIAVTPGGPLATEIKISRPGYGVGASFQLGFGQLDVSYTIGELEVDIPGVLTPPAKIDQGRINATLGHTYANGVTAALGVTRFLNEETLGWDDKTATVLSVGYDFRNGFSVSASYSPDSSAIGDDTSSDETWAIGAKYSF